MKNTKTISSTLLRAFIGFTLAVGLSALGIAGLSGCESGAAPNPERPPPPVSIAVAVTKDVPVYLDAIGKIVAREKVAVQPQVSGRIMEIHFADGANVKKGELLFTVDPRPYRAQLMAAEATLAQHQAALGLAQIEFARVQSVIDKRAISRQDYDNKKNAIRVAEAQVKQSQAARETARLNFEYCFIRSPINGRAGVRLVDLGNVVTANNTELLTIQRLDPIYADFTITENDLTAVQENMADKTLEVEVRLPDALDHPRVGELTFLDNAVQETTGTVKLRATLDNKDQRFWPNRFVKVRLVLRTLNTAVLVPVAAPQMSAKGSFVYVIKEDQTAELRPVTLGQPQGDLIVVASGLKAGERVVTQGQLAVMPAAKVKVQSSERVAPPVAEKK